MFRFPKHLIKVEALKPYCVEDSITVETKGNYVVLDIDLSKEGGEWSEGGEGWLTRLIPLRNAILQGDYRVLYLAWLRACELEFGEEALEEKFEEEDLEEEEEYYDPSFLEFNHAEPPVPPNLKKLDGALQAFIEFFELDPMWVVVGVAASPGVAKTKEPLEEWVAALPEADCRRLLLRAVQDESNSGLYLRNELRQRF